MAEPAPLLRVRGLGKRYAAVTRGQEPVVLFRDLSLDVQAGETVAIVGASGAGKSTLLHLLAALDTPTRGEVWCAETRVDTLRGSAAADFRSRTVGYVWQFHYLLPEFTAAENVAMPLLARREPRVAALTAAASWLERVGLSGREAHRSGELSGGEQQRVAIARALVVEPKLLLADEPTGDLDETNAALVADLLLALGREAKLATVLVTHNLVLAARCDRVLRLREGVLQTA